MSKRRRLFRHKYLSLFFVTLFRLGLSPDTMFCLSRNDKEKNIFTTKRRKRWNFYPLIDIKNGSLICKNENYSINKLCGSGEVKNWKSFCTIDSTTVNLDPR